MSAAFDDLTNGIDVGTVEPGNGPPRAADARLFHSITLRNLLSFPPENKPLELKNLNVLIGPNGSGKSNLLAAIGLLRAATSDMRNELSRGGGVGEWIWKGRPGDVATMEAVVADSSAAKPLTHALAFRVENQQFQVQEEQIASIRPPGIEGDSHIRYRFSDGRPLAKQVGENSWKLVFHFSANQSILAQRNAPESYPEISHLNGAYGGIRLYREWSIGRNSVFREPQKADLRTDRLEEDFSNLGLFLNKLRRNPKAKQALLAHLRDLYDGLTDFDVSVEGGTLQVFFTEGDFTIPAPRLSDGSLRYLCLLAILCDHDPPPLIGIEEPELGLHPDLLPKLADLLVEASTRCQLIVTTHSDILVGALSDQPEAIVVCEKHDGQTSMRRLDAKEPAPWLEKYRLGQLWTSGELGGTRW